MTAYSPNPTVEFNGGLFFADNTISNISINYGRKDVTEQPQPSFARIELWTDADTPLGVALSQSVTVKIDKGTSGTQAIFEGTVSDIEISLDAYGDIGSIARYSITAIGPLALLNRRMVGGSGYSKEYDGTRIINILSEAFLTSWADINALVQWQDLPNGVSWDSYDATNEALVNNLVANVDVPGQYELHAYNDGSADAYTLATQAANSGRGVLWEGADGDIHYDDYLSRATNTPLTLTAGDLASRGLRTAAQWGEIVNDVTVTYKANATKNAQDPQSQVLYGQLVGTRNTDLENGTDAQNQADDFLSQRAYPRMYPEELGIPLHSPTVTDAKRDSLAAVYCGLPVVTSALPAVFGTNFSGFVEGWTWNLTRYTADLTLTCSAYSETYSSIIWYQIPPTTTWSGYTPSTTEWQDL